MTMNPPSTKRASTLAVAAALTLSAFAHAQTELRPVDNWSAGSLAGPGRTTQADLRAPTAFERVYRVMSNGRDTGLVARSQGGLVATYSSGQPPPVPGTVPAGTIFHIGTPQFVGSWSDDAPSRSRVPRPTSAVTMAPRGQIDNSARGYVPTAAPASQSDPVPAPLSVFTDENYRVRVVSVHLDRALASRVP